VASAPAVVPFAAAIPESVSPERTVWVAPDVLEEEEDVDAAADVLPVVSE
jgi:hypothetical protein